MPSTSPITTAHAGHLPASFTPNDEVGNSLVKGSICPTRLQSTAYELINHHGEIIGELFDLNSKAVDVQQSGTWLSLAYRKWSDEWRLKMFCETPYGQLPPDNSGERITHRLSWRGAQALGEACEYVTQMHGGFTTFATLTVTPEVREKLHKRKAHKDGAGNPEDMCNGITADGEFTRIRWRWEASIQREVSRFFDSLSKMHERGWIPPYRRETVVNNNGCPYTPITWNIKAHKLDGIADGLHYIWVAENPQNDQGKRNPHIHVLMKWSIPYEYFPCWAHRIEKLWGQGFARLEKLRSKESAGYYIAKAAGYLSKAYCNDDQGPVRGNRYGIAQHSRAPGWEPVLVWAWGIMGYLINACREKMRAKYAPLYTQRDQLRTLLKNTPNSDTKYRNKISSLLTQTRKKIKAIPAYFGSFIGVFKGHDNIDKFLSWAERKGWKHDKRPHRMWHSEWLRQHNARKEYRRMKAVEYDTWAMDELYRHALRWEPYG